MWLLLISILDITLKMIFLMISVDNTEHYLFKEILYCESLIYSSTYHERTPSGPGKSVRT